MDLFILLRQHNISNEKECHTVSIIYTCKISFTASVDVDRIAQEVDVDAIQNNILNVTYCAIEHELVC